MNRLIGVLLVGAAAVVGVIAGLWTVFRALGAEADYCPGGGGCISAYAFTVPAIILSIVLIWVGVGLLRRR